MRFVDLEGANGRLTNPCSRAVERHIDHLDRRDTEYEVIATRGQRLALVTERSLESVRYAVYGIDNAERIASVDVLDDADDAFDELEKLFAEGEGLVAASIILAYGRIMRAFNTQEWTDLRSRLTDDLVLDDHRPIFLGHMGPDEWVESLRVSTQLGTGRRGESKAYHAWELGRAVIEFRFVTGSPSGEYFEMRHHGVFEAREDRICRIEFYPPEQLDRALARFEELKSD